MSTRQDNELPAPLPPSAPVTAWDVVKAATLDTTLLPLTKLVLIGLAVHMSKKNGLRVWPSQQRLADLLNVSKVTVTRSLADLEARGRIIPMAYGKGGRGHATEYRIRPPAQWASVDEEADARACEAYAASTWRVERNVIPETTFHAPETLSHSHKTLSHSHKTLSHSHKTLSHG